MDKQTTPSAPTVWRRSFPILTVMTVGLGVLKYGFGVAIPLLWVFAPLWMLPALIALVFVAVLAIALVILVILGVAYGCKTWSDRATLNRRRRKMATFSRAARFSKVRETIYAG